MNKTIQKTMTRSQRVAANLKEFYEFICLPYGICRFRYTILCGGNMIFWRNMITENLLTSDYLTEKYI